MMKRLLITGGGLAAVLIASVVSFVPALANSPAIVFNHADGSTCTFVAFGGAYNGPATIVQSGSGQVNAQCNASLVLGRAVGSAIRVTDIPTGTVFGPVFCDVQYTRSGKANVSCHN